MFWFTRPEDFRNFCMRGIKLKKYIKSWKKQLILDFIDYKPSNGKLEKITELLS